MALPIGVFALVCDYAARPAGVKQFAALARSSKDVASHCAPTLGRWRFERAVAQVKEGIDRIRWLKDDEDDRAWGDCRTDELDRIYIDMEATKERVFSEACVLSTYLRDPTRREEVAQLLCDVLDELRGYTPEWLEDLEDEALAIINTANGEE